MRATLAVLTLAVLAGTSAGADHLAAPEAVRARVAAAAGGRTTDLGALDAALATPAAERLAAAVGADVDALRRALPSLGDDELRDLAQRARLLQQDPAAGLSGDVNQLLIIFLIVAIVVLVLQAVD
jgi:hypothetical protein